MMRLFPVAWTTIELAVASAAAWLLYETDALGGAAVLFVH
jgi:hypothetical protein